MTFTGRKSSEKQKLQQTCHNRLYYIALRTNQLSWRASIRLSTNDY